jgi:hypothetical protein
MNHKRSHCVVKHHSAFCNYHSNNISHGTKRYLLIESAVKIESALSSAVLSTLNSLSLSLG